MTPKTLTNRVAELPYRLRHIVACIVAQRLSPRDPQGAITQEWRERAAPYKQLWAMARDHEPHYEWPASDELADVLRSLGLGRKLIADAIAMYDSHGEPETAAQGQYHARQLGYFRPEGTKPGADKVDDKYEWCGAEVVA